MKTIRVKVTEKATYTIDVEVEESWPATWTGIQTYDARIAEQLHNEWNDSQLTDREPVSTEYVEIDGWEEVR